MAIRLLTILLLSIAATMFVASCDIKGEDSNKISTSDINHISYSIFNSARLSDKRSAITVDRKFNLVEEGEKSGQQFETYEREVDNDSTTPSGYTFFFDNDYLVKLSCRWNRSNVQGVDPINHHLSNILGREFQLIGPEKDICYTRQRVLIDGNEIYFMFTIISNMEILSIANEDDLL